MSKSACTCGHNVKDGNEDTQQLNSGTFLSRTQLDASFVHLPSPRPNMNDNLLMQHNGDSSFFSQGMLDSYRYHNTMLQVAEKQIDHSQGFGNEADICLCSDCIERIASAIEENTFQLEAETVAYNNAVQAEKGKHRSLIRALKIRDSIDRNDEMIVNSGNTSSLSPVHDENQSPQDIVQSILEKLEHEVQLLAISSQEHLNELKHLDELIDEQAHISKTLTEQEFVWNTEFNSLQIDANAFQDMQRHLTHQCHAVEVERFLLSKVQLHSSLFDITVDDRVSKRFPLINNLRLTHRPTPKGVSWLEINSAWSQAAQLVIFVGSATHFKSKDLRIVPLTSCAKIIELLQGNKIIVNHLGVDFESNARKTHETESIVSSVRAFHALLHQLSAHMLHTKPHNALDKIPFETRMYSIGSHDLRRLLEMDDVGWGGVIHCMAANMKWMVQNSCKFAPLV